MDFGKFGQSVAQHVLRCVHVSLAGGEADGGMLAAPWFVFAREHVLMAHFFPRQTRDTLFDTSGSNCVNYDTVLGAQVSTTKKLILLSLMYSYIMLSRQCT